MDALKTYSLTNIKSSKFIQGFCSEIETDASNKVTLKIKRKDVGYSLDNKYDRWRFPFNSKAKLNRNARINYKVFRCPGLYNKLACEFQCHDSVNEYNIYLAKYTNKVVLKGTHPHTYSVEGTIPTNRIELNLIQFYEKLE